MDSDQIKGKLQNVFGKAEEAIGHAIGNQNLANAGTEDQLKGSAKETWGNVKDTANHVGDSVHSHTSDTADSTGESIRDKVVRGTDHLKESINNRLDDVKERDTERRL